MLYIYICAVACSCPIFVVRRFVFCVCVCVCVTCYVSGVFEPRILGHTIYHTSIFQYLASELFAVVSAHSFDDLVVYMFELIVDVKLRRCYNVRGQMNAYGAAGLE